MKAVITAGGHGTRLRPITWTMNKHLIPLANEPMLWHAIKKVAHIGVKEVAINVNPGEVDSMRAACGDGERWGVHLTYLEQEGGACGVGQILWSARDFVGDDDVLLYFGDNIVLGSLQSLVDKFYNESLDASFAFVEVPDPQRFGVPEFDAKGTLLRILEKPERPPSPYGQTGLYIYRMPKYLDAFEHIVPSARGEYEIADINSYVIAHGKAGYQVMVGWWKDTGTPDALLEGNQLLLNEMTFAEASVDATATVDASARVQGRVRIGAGAFVGPGALVRGPVVIGERTRITGAFIGPHTSIGNDVHIEGGEVMHSIIMNEAIIKTQKRIMDSIIGQAAKLDGEASTVNGAHRMVIGQNSTLAL